MGKAMEKEKGRKAEKELSLVQIPLLKNLPTPRQHVVGRGIEHQAIDPLHPLVHHLALKVLGVRPEDVHRPVKRTSHLAVLIWPVSALEAKNVHFDTLLDVGFS